MPTITERDLFRGYRRADGRYYAECACGQTIVAASGSEDVVAAAITDHQKTELHLEWRSWQRAVAALRRPAKHRCPCCGGDFSEPA